MRSNHGSQAPESSHLHGPHFNALPACLDLPILLLGVVTLYMAVALLVQLKHSMHGFTAQPVCLLLATCTTLLSSEACVTTNLTVLRCAVLRCAALCCAMLCLAVLYRAVLACSTPTVLSSLYVHHIILEAICSLALC